jgi:hypothetical protein
MRLAQLARKLSVRPSEIVDLLSQNQFFFEDGSNTKLNDDQVRSVVFHFAPERMSEIMLVQTTEATEPEAQPETTSETPIEDKTESVSEILNSVTESNTPETIRAPKVELTGLKVLGKIELPQPRVKDETKAEGMETNTEKPKLERRDRQPRRDREERQWRNPVALQREAEVREREELRLEALKQEKERKRMNYLNKVKNSKPPKAARIYEETAPTPAKVSEQKPRTWVGKFLRWLNT